MPITLNHSNINVQYETGKNYNIETVKSDLYVRNENVDTVIRNNIQTAPVTPTTFVDSSGNVYAVESYTYTGTANTADYTRVFPKNTTCDILVVGGGGGGGQLGGGGGGGAVLFSTNILFSVGSNTIKVGKGGTGVSTNSQNGNNGENSSIIINGIEYIAKGGGGGGSRDANYSARNGSDGGSGGGGSLSNNTTVQGFGGNSNKNTYTGWLSYGNSGGKGRLGISGSEPNHSSGGGGGAGSIGGDFSNTTGGGNGGSGMSFISTFGSSVGDKGFFGGGGGGNTTYGAGNPGYGNGGLGLFGGGGNGGFDAARGINAQNGLSNTGGGGGGSRIYGPTSSDNKGGNGGSGVVIIRYLLGTIPSTNFLTNEPTVSPSITSNLAIFTHSGGTENQTSHSIYFPENTVCDVLIVGGGGAGGKDIGAGGGGGAVLYGTNISIPAGSYIIKVGRGGTPGEVRGQSTEVFGATLLGGGCAGNATWAGATLANSGGSGAGGKSLPDVASKTGGTVGSSTKGTILTTATLYNGNVGGTGVTQSNNVQSSGGGGAASVGGNGNTSSANLGIDKTGNGGDGVLVNITGVNYYWGGGGGGGCYQSPPTDGGRGGGGAGQRNDGAGSLGFGTGGADAYNAPVNMNAGAGTGGGGGGSGYTTTTAGNGGSGIVIIRVISPTTSKYLFFNYLPAQPTLNYTINFPSRTMVNFINSGDEVMSGEYTVSVRTTQSTIIPTQGQNLQDRLYFTSNFAIRYSLLNPILDPIGAQWTYSSNNTNVYHLGSVGIGTTNPEYSLDVRGNIYSSSGGYTQSGLTTWSITSDRRIKENIVKASYEKCLENVKNIELYNFNFKDNYVNTNDRRQLGFIAQEVQQVYPKAVEVNRIISNNNDGIDNILSLNTTQIKYTLYGAVKNLIEKVENIESKVNNLYDKVFVKPILNTSNITSNITSNTSNITSISSNITSNTSNITSNTSNITSNTSNVEQQ